VPLTTERAQESEEGESKMQRGREGGRKRERGPRGGGVGGRGLPAIVGHSPAVGQDDIKQRLRTTAGWKNHLEALLHLSI